MWADRGECKNSKQYMMDHCKASCKYCTEKGPRPKDEVELHPLSVARISAEVGVKPAPAGSEGTTPAAATDAASADAAAEAAKQKAAAEKAAADKAAAEKAATEKAAADKAATAAQAAAEAATAAKTAAAAKVAADNAAATRAVDGPSEEEMRGKYQASSLSYAALVKR